MNDPGSAAVLAIAVPNPDLALGDFHLALLALLALTCTGFFALLRAALLHSVPARVLEGVSEERQRRRLAPLLERAESFSTSASIYEITCQICFVVFVLALVPELASRWAVMGVVLALCVPLLVFTGELFPTALLGTRSDALLRSVLPTFDLLQRPLAALSYVLDATRRGLMKLLRIPERARATRRIVEDLRDVIEESEREGELDENERELIENVVEFRDVDVAAVMTPRTELHAVDVGKDVAEVMEAISESGHTRIPVYEKNLDTIVGIAYAQDVIRLISRGELENSSLRGIVRPVTFVPETKLVSELLTEFRAEKQKMAVVLDEYGGTAGLVTMVDIMAEIIGDIREEFGEGFTDPIRALPDGIVEIQASMRVSDVNEELELELPEESDYETLAGFVLAQLGHFPKNGESFHWGGFEFLVTEASDRRVLAVRLRELPKQRTG